MHTTEKVISDTRRNINERARAKKDRSRGRQVPKARPSKIDRPRNDFLRKRFKPLKAVSVLPEFSDENYNFIYDSAKNYSNLLGSSFDLPHDGDFAKLYTALGKIIKQKDQRLIFIDEDGDLKLKVSYKTDFLQKWVYFIPCRIINFSNGRFKEIMARLLRCFIGNGVTTVYDFWDYEMITDSWECNDIEHDDPETFELLKSYTEGDIKQAFKYIQSFPYDLLVLEKMLRRYKPSNEHEAKLIELAQEGVEIFNLNEAIFSYVVGPDEVDEEYDVGDYNIIEADRLIRLVYDREDAITDSIIEVINTDTQDGYSEYIPATSLELTPETNTILTPGYPEIFFKWVNKIIDEMEAYCEKDKLINILDNEQHS